MIAASIIAGFTLGAAGSLHCVGMCGPLSLALPTYHLSGFKKFIALSLYQFGRIITYSFLGLILGLAGRKIYLTGYQQWFSIITGSLFVIAAIFYFLGQKTTSLKFAAPFYVSVQKIIAKLLKSANTYSGFFLIGMANGLLPCGMVYIALASVLTFNTVQESIVFMAMFGAGTYPAMMMASYAAQLFKKDIRFSLQKLVPVFISIMGVVLILRGLNLGIPFISPELPSAPGQAVVCHP